MQISTRTEDFIIDTLELRSDMNILNETFTDPAIVKVSCQIHQIFLKIIIIVVLVQALFIFIVKITLCALSWSLNSAFTVICSGACFLDLSGELLARHTHLVVLYVTVKNREKKSGPRHMNMKAQHYQPEVEMFFISFPNFYAFQGPSWC